MQPKIRERSSVLLSALGNVTRLKIVEHLVGSPATVNDIAHALDIGQSGTSQHLAKLARAGVVLVHPSGNTRVYALRGPRIGKILGLIEEFCNIHQLEGDDDIEVEHAE